MLKTMMEFEPNFKYAANLLNEKLEDAIAKQLDCRNDMDTPQRNEMDEIKPKLHQLMKAGKTDEVAMILAQLEQMAPNDTDLIAIKNRIALCNSPSDN